LSSADRAIGLRARNTYTFAIDVTSYEEVPANFFAALKDRNVDSVVAFSDEYVIATAKAAEMLNLPTEPIEAISCAS